MKHAMICNVFLLMLVAVIQAEDGPGPDENGMSMGYSVITLPSNQALGGTLIAGLAYPGSQKTVSINTVAGESAESVTDRLAKEMREVFEVPVWSEGGELLFQAMSPGRFFLSGTDQAFVLEPVANVIVSEGANGEIIVSWDCPEHLVGGSANVVAWRNGNSQTVLMESSGSQAIVIPVDYLLTFLDKIAVTVTVVSANGNLTPSVQSNEIENPYKVNDHPVVEIIDVDDAIVDD